MKLKGTVLVMFWRRETMPGVLFRDHWGFDHAGPGAVYFQVLTDTVGPWGRLYIGRKSPGRVCAGGKHLSAWRAVMLAHSPSFSSVP